MTGRQRRILATFLATALMAGVGFERLNYHTAARAMQAVQNVELSNLDIPRVDAIYAYAPQQALGASWGAAETAGWALCLLVLALWGLRGRASMTALALLAAYAAMGNPLAAQAGYGLMSLAGVDPGPVTSPQLIAPAGWLYNMAGVADGILDGDLAEGAFSAAYLLKEAMRAFVVGAAAWLAWDLWGAGIGAGRGKGAASAA